MMTIQELQELLKQFPEDYGVVIEVMGVEDNCNAVAHRPKENTIVLCRE